jgi:CubicO group peptidase (beta-lactamase class C family)
MFWGFAVYATSIFAGDGTVSKGPPGESIGKFVQACHESFGFSGTVMAAKNGRVVAAFAFGSTDGRKPVPLDTHTLFEIASCTKPFTAIAIFRLVEQEKLKLDDSIAQHLPNVPENCREITIRHLLQHASGILGTNTRGSGNQIDKVLPTFLAGGPKHKPGTHWEYWNQGYSLLSEIIARSSGKKFTSFCRDEIFKPCDMKSTRFTGGRAPGKIKVATGVSSYGQPRTALEHPYGEYGFQYRGMGGIVTNVVDLWKWEKSLREGKLLTAESIALMTDTGEFPYALGWHVDQAGDDELVHHHSGSVRGFVSSVRRYPKSESCLVVLSNRDDSFAFKMVESGCEQLLFGKEIEVEFPARLDAETRESTAGKYADSKGRTLTITSFDEIVKATIDWGGPRTVGCIGKDDVGAVQFFMAESFNPLRIRATNSITFGRQGEGNSSSVLLGGLANPIKFQRVK